MAMNFTVNLAEQVVEIKFGDDIIKRKIKVDEEGHQYFSVPNLMNNPTHSRLNQFFTKRIKDAVETIRNGDGDVLHVSNLLNIASVLYFLDRDYGSVLREKFLKGWSDAEFAYAIGCGNTCELDTNNNFSNPNTHIKYFDTEVDAANYLSNLQKNAIQYVKKYETLTEDEQSSFWSENSFSDAIENLILFELQRIENPNTACPLRVIQTIRKK